MSEFIEARTDEVNAYLEGLEAQLETLFKQDVFCGELTNLDPRNRIDAIQRITSSQIGSDELRRKFIELVDYIRRHDPDQLTVFCAIYKLREISFSPVEVPGEKELYRFRTIADGGKRVRKERLYKTSEIARGRTEYENLSRDYGIPVVSYEILKGERATYKLVDEIVGPNLSQLPLPVDEVCVALVDKVYASLIQYAFDRAMTDRPLLTDIYAYEQYVYGHKKGEEENRVYLVDIDYYLQDYNQLSFLVRSAIFNAYTTEFRLNVQNRFTATRAVITQVTKQLEDKGMLEPVLNRALQQMQQMYS